MPGDTPATTESPEAPQRRCPWCAEPIQPEAIKCRWCGEYLDEPPPQRKRRGGLGLFIIAFIFVGPLALPLLWRADLSTRTKTVVTGLALIATAGMIIAMERALQTYFDLLNQIGH